MKTALVHDWLVSSVGGSENCLREIYSLYPSPIYTLRWDPAPFKDTELRSSEVHTSFIEKLPFGKKKFRSYLPFFPLAIEQFDLKDYDLILSSSHCVAKGVLTHSDQLHICYCYTPVRYAWDLSFEYLKEAGLEKGIKAALAKAALHYLRMWDVQSAQRVDHFIAISHFVARRIEKLYGRKADVIYPPVNTDFFQLGDKKEDYYLTASRLVSYKKIDLIVEAFSKMPDKKLIVIGDGPEMKKLQKIKPPNVELMGYQPDTILLEKMQKAKAFIFAALEDFGILPLEAMATGTPVIALDKGGLSELVTEYETGIFFENQCPLSIIEAVSRFEKVEKWNPLSIREYALKFSQKRFREEYQTYIEAKKKEKCHENSYFSRRRRNSSLASFSPGLS